MTGKPHDAADIPTAGAAVADSPAWAPLRQQAFRWLWLGVLISGVGTNTQTVGAQWLLIAAPNAAALVSVVQTANTLPIMLLAVAGGLLLAGLTAAGRMPPALLLAFTFALGAGVALQQPAWGATIPKLVSRAQLRAASRLSVDGSYWL